MGRGHGSPLKSTGPPRPASASRRLMMTAMAASSLPSLEAEEEGGLFFLALSAPCMIWSLRVMLFPLLLLLLCRCLCLLCSCCCCCESLWLLQQASAPSRLCPAACAWPCPVS